ncbi:MAG: carboxymuconolactone decarboxylase family protein [Ginsengibacter sp.]
MKRIRIKDLEPHAFKAMLGMEQYIRSTSLPKALCELIKIRASQINGCAYCLDMHTQEAIQIGETTRRIFALSAWKESPLFSEKERAALQLAEEVTLISEDGVCDETYDSAIKLFGDQTVAQIIMQIIIINSWNRIAVATRDIFEG